MTKKIGKKADTDGPVIALLERMAGVEEGRKALTRLLSGAESPSQLAERIALSESFQQLYKRARTLDVGVEGAKDSDPEYVGLPSSIRELPFDLQFRDYFAAKLGKRAIGFGILFNELLQLKNNLLIIETGCMRIPQNWEGDGQSTFMFDALIRATGGLFYSIDASLESIDTSRRACSAMTQIIFNDSVAALHAMNKGIRRQANLIYLDSFDFDENNPLPSAIHHSLELTAAGTLVGSGTILCIDDYALGSNGGKGMIVDKFMSNIGAEILHVGYQKIWRVP